MADPDTPIRFDKLDVVTSEAGAFQEIGTLVNFDDSHLNFPHLSGAMEVDVTFTATARHVDNSFHLIFNPIFNRVMWRRISPRTTTATVSPVHTCVGMAI